MDDDAGAKKSRSDKYFELIIFLGSTGAFVWALLHWILMIHFSDDYNDYDYISYAGIIVGTIAIGVFLLVPNLRTKSPWNTLLLLLIVQCIALSMATVITKASLNFVFVCIGISVVLVTAITISGTTLGEELTLRDDQVTLLLAIFIINSFLIFAISYTVDFKLCVYTFCATFLMLSLSSLLLHSQALGSHTRRTIPDVHYGIFAFFMHFILLFTLFFYVAALIWPQLLHLTYFLRIESGDVPELNPTKVLNSVTAKKK